MGKQWDKQLSRDVLAIHRRSETDGVDVFENWISAINSFGRIEVADGEDGRSSCISRLWFQKTNLVVNDQYSSAILLSPLHNQPT